MIKTSDERVVRNLSAAILTLRSLNFFSRIYTVSSNGKFVRCVCDLRDKHVLQVSTFVEFSLSTEFGEVKLMTNSQT